MTTTQVSGKAIRRLVKHNSAGRVSQVFNVNKRAHRRGQPDTFTSSDWLRALHYFNGQCAVCGVLFSEVNRPTIDHWLPLVGGGTNTAHNCLPLCYGCNDDKHDAAPVDWLLTRYTFAVTADIFARVYLYFAWTYEQKSTCVELQEGGAS